MTLTPEHILLVVAALLGIVAIFREDAILGVAVLLVSLAVWLK